MSEERKNKMAKQLRTKTEYDFERLKELQWVVGTAIVPEQTKWQRGIMFGVAVVCAVLGVVLRFAFHLMGTVVLCFCLSAFFLAWGTFFFYLRAVTAARAMQLNKKKVINEFVFDKDSIVAYLNNQSARYLYANCKRLLEAEYALYVILEGGQGLMLDKSNVAGGTADDLRAWLEEKCEATTEWVGRSKQPS